LREELLDFRRRLLAKPEARKASAYRLVRDMLLALGDDERGLQRTPYDAWANEDVESGDVGEPWQGDAQPLLAGEGAEDGGIRANC